MKIFKIIRGWTDYIALRIRKDWLAHAFLHFGIVVFLVTQTPLTPTQAWICSAVFGVLYELVWDWILCEDEVEVVDIIFNTIGGGLAWLIFVI